MKHEGNKTDKLEKFMIRIGVFSILYMLPAIIVICCYFYEQSSYDKWMDFWLKRNAIDFNIPPDYVSSRLLEADRSSLIFFVFMAKYAMLLVVGITSGFWIWSHKTITSWQNFFDKISSCFLTFKPKYKNEAAV
jgi:frizzled protein 1/7